MCVQWWRKARAGEYLVDPKNDEISWTEKKCSKTFFRKFKIILVTFEKIFIQAFSQV